MRVFLFLSLCLLAAAFKPLKPLRPVARFITSRRAAAAVALPDEVVDVYNGHFKRPLFGTEEATTPSPSPRKQPPPSKVDVDDVITLWTALVAAYGSSDVALAGVKANPTLLSPLYSGPSKIAESKAALLQVFEGSEDEVLEVMLQNPALLQCGTSLLQQRPEEIKGFAAVRATFDKVPPAASKAILSLVLGTTLLNIMLAQSTDDANVLTIVSVLKPILGFTFASLFVGIAGMLAMQEASSKRARKAASQASPADTSEATAETTEMGTSGVVSESQLLMQKVKDAGVAGIVSYIFWEWAFWGVTIPVCVGGYYVATGHLPDFSNQEDVARLGAEAIAIINVARFAVPLRIGLALSTAPWVRANVIDKFQVKAGKDEQ